MANEEHLNTLREGFFAWNSWRQNTPEVLPDLSGADLSRSDLQGFNFKNADLSGANMFLSLMVKSELQETNLQGADLGSAQLRGADFAGADLRKALLRDANLTDANFINANLEDANLRGAYLIRADLRNTNLRGAHLEYAMIRAYLANAQLTKATLFDAYIGQANLSGAILEDANLRNADLSKANLQEANLSGADLNKAALDGANLRKTNLTGSLLSETVFVDVNLSEAIGLDECNHRGPSTIDQKTLARSGNLPRVFLRGIGLQDWEIENVELLRPNLSNEEINDIIYRVYDNRAHQAIQINPLFISYTHKDGEFVDAIEKKLINKGIRFWRDIHHATSGRLEKQVDRAMRLNDTVLLVLSENSVNSDWVELEATKARKLEKETGRDVLCPVALDKAWKTCDWPERLRLQIEKYNILDFSEWKIGNVFQRQFTRLLDGLDLFY